MAWRGIAVARVGGAWLSWAVDPVQLKLTVVFVLMGGVAVQWDTCGCRDCVCCDGVIPVDLTPKELRQRAAEAQAEAEAEAAAREAERAREAAAAAAAAVQADAARAKAAARDLDNAMSYLQIGTLKLSRPSSVPAVHVPILRTSVASGSAANAATTAPVAAPPRPSDDADRSAQPAKQSLPSTVAMDAAASAAPAPSGVVDATEDSAAAAIPNSSDLRNCATALTPSTSPPLPMSAPIAAVVVAVAPTLAAPTSAPDTLESHWPSTASATNGGSLPAVVSLVPVVPPSSALERAPPAPVAVSVPTAIEPASAPSPCTARVPQPAQLEPSLPHGGPPQSSSSSASRPRALPTTTSTSSVLRSTLVVQRPERALPTSSASSHSLALPASKSASSPALSPRPVPAADAAAAATTTTTTTLPALPTAMTPVGVTSGGVPRASSGGKPARSGTVAPASTLPPQPSPSHTMRSPATSTTTSLPVHGRRAARSTVKDGDAMFDDGFGKAAARPRRV